MTKVTTAHLLADKAMLRPCGQWCIDWAVTMLEEGRDGHYLTMLAGQLPPHNHFGIASLLDRALVEQAIPDLDASVVVRTFAAEQLRLALAGDTDLIEVLGTIKDLCVDRDYSPEIYDFFLLYWAYTDLLDSDCQWYWEGATRTNIVSIIRQRAEEFLRES